MISGTLYFSHFGLFIAPAEKQRLAPRWKLAHQCSQAKVCWFT